MISKINLKMSNVTTFQSLEIQTDDKELYRERLHEMLDEWFNKVSNKANFNITHTQERMFQIS